jgi:hypothetical protein
LSVFLVFLVVFLAVVFMFVDFIVLLAEWTFGFKLS